jgi:hypothetical protein
VRWKGSVSDEVFREIRMGSEYLMARFPENIVVFFLKLVFFAELAKRRD